MKHPGTQTRVPTLPGKSEVIMVREVIIKGEPHNPVPA